MGMQCVFYEIEAKLFFIRLLLMQCQQLLAVLASHRNGQGPVLGQIIWDLWQINLHWGELSSGICFPLSILIPPAAPHSLITRRCVSSMLSASLSTQPTLQLGGYSLLIPTTCTGTSLAQWGNGIYKRRWHKAHIRKPAAVELRSVAWNLLGRFYVFHCTYSQIL